MSAHEAQLAFPTWPSFEEDEVAAATEVLRSGKVNYWTGQQCLEFEKEFASYIGCSHAVAVANGTVSLEISLRALGVGPGDEVIVPSRSYFATASAVVAVGARPVFADVDLDSQNLTAATIQAVVTERTKAVIVVHLAGWPCDMTGILALTRKLDLYVVEDCAQAHGATIQGQKVGSFGDIGSFSFCQDKIMTTAGEGGMVTTNSKALWAKMWSFKDHGKNYETVHKQHAPGFRWLHESFGSNLRLTEIQAAIGRKQLQKLPRWIAARNRHAHQLSKRLGEIPGLRIPIPDHQYRHAYYKFYMFVEPEQLHNGWIRDRIAAEIASSGVPCSTGSCSEIYLEAAFPTEWRPATRLPNARQLGETSLMFQVHPTLSSHDVEMMANVIESVMASAAGSMPSHALPATTA